MTYKKTNTQVGYAAYPTAEKQPGTEVDESMEKPVVEEPYAGIEVVKEEDGLMVEDPYFDAEMTDILETIVETEGGEVSFEQTWEYSKGAIIESLSGPEYTDKLFQMLEMAENIGDEILPEDFLETFDILHNKYIVEVFQSIAKGNMKHAGNALDTVQPYVTSTGLIDINIFLELSSMYSNARQRTETYKQMQIEFGEVVEVFGAEDLFEAYKEVLTQVAD